MGKAEDTRNEINAITAKLIEIGICDDQKYAILRSIGHNRKEVSFNTSSQFSLVLRNLPYAEIYNEIKSARDYNVALPDGGLLQLQYIFAAEEIIRHRLAFFPSPDLTEYQNDPEIYESDLMFAEVISRHTVTTPIRFDFDRDSFVEDSHPMSHFTIGQYQNCRIPVSSAISPFRFFEFVLGSFYNTAYRDFRGNLQSSRILHSPTITNAEMSRIHINLEVQSN